MVAYLVGIIWWIFVEIEIANNDYFGYDEMTFIGQKIPDKFFGGDENGNSDSQMRNVVGVFYFAFTTLTTVGFGDLKA